MSDASRGESMHLLPLKGVVRMTKFRWILNTGLILGLMVLPGIPHSIASDCDRDFYSHNGSMMEIDACPDGGFTISYENPKASLRKHGVGPGTLLFEGRFWDTGGMGLRKVTGTARLFKNGCPPALYQVDGYWLEDNVLEMSGAAPVRRKGCQASSTRRDDLRFVPM